MLVNRRCGKKRKVTALRKKKPFSLIPERFFCSCILCTESLAGRCYWEVEWRVKQLERTERLRTVCLTVRMSPGVCRNRKTRTSIPIYPTSNRVGVYLEYADGRISFFDTIHSTFTKPLFPGFGLGRQSTVHVSPIFTIPTIHDPDILPILSSLNLQFMLQVWRSLRYALN